MPFPFVVTCLDCGHRLAYDPRRQDCPNCGGSWLEARYELAGRGPEFLQSVRTHPHDLWRYRQALPLTRFDPAVSLGEGWTPLLPAPNLGDMLGLEHLYIKDERQSPTASFKDRQAAVTVAVLKEAGISEAVVASTGNVAISFAAYCARAGIHLTAFLTSLVPAEKMHEAALYGTHVIKVTGTYDLAKQLAAEFALARGLYLDRGTRSIASVEGLKTLAFEIAEQLGEAAAAAGLASPGFPWLAPDWYVQSVSGGVGPLGMLKGFDDLRAMGLVQGMPALAVVQAAGCAPMAQAWGAGTERAEPVESPATHITTLSTGDPGRAYTLLRSRMLDGPDGVMESVSDEEAFRSLRIVAQTEGISMEPAAGVAFAGLFKLVHSGRILPHQVVVVNCSGHTLPVEKSMLGEGWVEDVRLADRRLPDSPQEGLLAALALLDRRKVNSVLVVDDHADARLLIRRILQAHGSFTVREAASGPEALALARRDLPDLLILDLMMPEMDGFRFLDHWKRAPETARVPVIVVTAKELTPKERKSLEGHIARLMMKGDFVGDDLLEEITRAIE
jgi:threonine synthase